MPFGATKKNATTLVVISVKTRVGFQGNSKTAMKNRRINTLLEADAFHLKRHVCSFKRYLKSHSSRRVRTWICHSDISASTFSPTLFPSSSILRRTAEDKARYCHLVYRCKMAGLQTTRWQCWYLDFWVSVKMPQT